jgi:hypothetical protein
LAALDPWYDTIEWTARAEPNVISPAEMADLALVHDQILVHKQLLGRYPKSHSNRCQLFQGASFVKDMQVVRHFSRATRCFFRKVWMALMDSSFTAAGLWATQSTLNKFLENNLIEASPQPALFLDSRFRGNDRVVCLSESFVTAA